MKKVVLIVTFGSGNQQALNLTLDKIEVEIKEQFKGYDVRRAFTSNRIIDIWSDRYGIKILNPEKALEKLYEEGYEKVIVHPLYMIPGREFSNLKEVVQKFFSEEKFKYIDICRPILNLDIKTYKFDYINFINALTEIMPKDKEILFMAHGTSHSGHIVYENLQSTFENMGYFNVKICTLEGRPGIKEIIPCLKEKHTEIVTIIPMLIMAGKHVVEDLLSEKPDSWKSLLEAVGISVDVYPHGLGESKRFRKLLIDRLKEGLER